MRTTPRTSSPCVFREFERFAPCVERYVPILRGREYPLLPEEHHSREGPHPYERRLPRLARDEHRHRTGAPSGPVMYESVHERPFLPREEIEPERSGAQSTAYPALRDPVRAGSGDTRLREAP